MRTTNIIGILLIVLGVLALAYQAPDRLLVTLGDNNVWQLDFSGNVVGGGPAYTDPGGDGFEGIVQAADGRIIASDYFYGSFHFVVTIAAIIGASAHLRPIATPF